MRWSLLAVTAAALLPVTAAAAPPRFSAQVDNPWFPLTPGTVYVYRGVKDGKPARDVVTVTHRVKTIQGAECRVVEDRLYLAGKLRERTNDWYTQDRKGSVWYFGEATVELDAKGRVTSTEGSWQAGRDGALPGIYMPARPKVGQTFRQEYLKGEAEDHFRVVAKGATVRVPFISSRQALVTREWTPLEPGVIDRKVYVRGVGEVLEKTLKGGDERLTLVSVRR